MTQVNAGCLFLEILGDRDSGQLPPEGHPYSQIGEYVHFPAELWALWRPGFCFCFFFLMHFCRQCRDSWERLGLHQPFLPSACSPRKPVSTIVLCLFGSFCSKGTPTTDHWPEWLPGQELLPSQGWEEGGW